MTTPVDYLPFLLLNFAYREKFADNAYVVGGAVRDLLLDREINDLDVAVRGDAVGLARKFADTAGGSFVLLDEDVATARVVIGRRSVDLSALRGGSIYADLAERDFTINAMALPLPAIDRALSGVRSGALKNFSIIDPFLGSEDLERKIIRMVSEQNFHSDPLRLLRAYRFAAALGFSIDEATERSLRRLAPLINSVAAERIAEELRAVFGAARSASTVAAMAGDSLLTALFPALRQGPMEEALRVYGATEEILNNTGRFFPGHEEALAAFFAPAYRRQGLKMAALFSRSGGLAAAALGLKLSVKERDFLEALESHRSSIRDLSRRGAPDTAALVGLVREQKDAFYASLTLAVAEAEIAGEAEASVMTAFCRSLLDIYHEQIVPRMRLLPLITGDDLIAAFGLAPSPLFKEILGALERLTLEGAIATKEEALEVVKERFLARADKERKQ